MGADELSGETPDQRPFLLWRSHHPYLYLFSWLSLWVYAQIRNAFSVVFATWPSMHDPIKSLLNVPDTEEADDLTDRWTKAKLKELEFVGLTVCRCGRFGLEMSLMHC